MFKKFKVFTNNGDWVVYARDAADAADKVRNLTYCRCRVDAVERVD